MPAMWLEVRRFTGIAAAERLRAVRLACLLSLAAAVPAPALAQSAELLQTYQSLETAKAEGKVQDALKYGDEAVRLTGTGADAQVLAQLLQNLGDYAAGAQQDAAARRYYEQALALQERALGPDHPDLVPVLTGLADLALRAGRFQDAEELELRVLALERRVYGDRHENVVASLGRLRDIYRAAGDAPAAAQVETQLQHAATRGELPNPGRNRRYALAHGFADVRVYYGTNRAPTGNLRPADYYGKARGDLQFGYFDVTIPAAHRAAELETQPRWADYVFDAGELRSRYVLLDHVVPLAKDDFVRNLQAQVNSSPSKDLFVFVHGFNNTFEDAARRAAQLAYDLDFDGTPVLYSWPSQGSPTAYAVDEAAVGISGRKLAEFLEIVVAQSGAAHVHILAHSMGNRALIEALQTFLARRAPKDRQHIFGQIVFTAPDVDRDYFVDAIRSLERAADRVTLYASNNDYALRSSQLLHGAPRAGTAGDVIIKLPGVDSINMSAVPADMLGHAYFAANAGAIFDVFGLLWRGDPPPRRCGMSGRSAGAGVPVWVFHADACTGEDLLEAGVMLKRFGDLARERVVENLATMTDPSQKQQWTLILNRLDGLLASAGTPVGGTAK